MKRLRMQVGRLEGWAFAKSPFTKAPFIKAPFIKALGLATVLGALGVVPIASAEGDRCGSTGVGEAANSVALLGHLGIESGPESRAVREQLLEIVQALRAVLADEPRSAGFLRDARAQSARQLRSRLDEAERSLSGEDFEAGLAAILEVRPSFFSEVERWHGVVREARIGLGECAGKEAFINLTYLWGIARTLTILADTLCGQFQCIDGSCVAPCVAFGGLRIISQVIDGLLELNAFQCASDHFGDVRAWILAENLLGDGVGGLSGARNEFETRLVVSLDEAVAGLASARDLEEVELQVADEGGELESALDALGAEIRAEAAEQEAEIDFAGRLRLEALLRDAAADSEMAVPVDLLLPRSAGGRIEDVREAVADAIVRTADAREPIHDALDYLREGDMALNADRRDVALENYLAAYREVTLP